MTERPGDLLSQIAAYPEWQSNLLVLWGEHDPWFDRGEPERYRKDVPDAEGHLLDVRHFALDTKADENAALVRDFTRRQN